jgi:hypothetical protein
MRAWFNGRTIAFQAVRPGSIPGARTDRKAGTLRVPAFLCLLQALTVELVRGNLTLGTVNGVWSCSSMVEQFARKTGKEVAGSIPVMITTV